MGCPIDCCPSTIVGHRDIWKVMVLQIRVCWPEGGRQDLVTTGSDSRSSQASPKVTVQGPTTFVQVTQLHYSWEALWSRSYDISFFQHFLGRLQTARHILLHLVHASAIALHFLCSWIWLWACPCWGFIQAPSSGFIQEDHEFPASRGTPMAQLGNRLSSSSHVKIGWSTTAETLRLY